MTAHKRTAGNPLKKYWCTLAGLVLLSLTACSVLRPTTTPPATLYALDNTSSAASTPESQTTLTLLVNRPHASAGFASQRIIYVREPHKLEFFARSEWVDPPARMLETLLVSALQNSGAFHAVVLLPNTAQGEVRLDTEIIRLQHEFLNHPSRVRFTLRATLLNDKTRTVLAWREFDASVPAVSETPQGGVAAANHAVQTVLKALADFCGEVAAAQTHGGADPAHF